MYVPTYHPRFIDVLATLCKDLRLECLLSPIVINTKLHILFRYTLIFPIASAPQEPGDSFNNSSLESRSQQRMHFELPIEGMTIRLCIQRGRIVFYGSFSVATPNCALNDFYANWTLKCNEMFINREYSGPSRNKRSTEQVMINKNTTLYVVIEGVEEENLYSMETSVGDTRRG